MPGDVTDFSSNRFVNTPTAEFEVPIRHSDMCFEDGNVALLSGHHYFLVHKGLLSRHSTVFHQMIDMLAFEDTQLLEGRPVLLLSHPPQDLLPFLRTLYGLPVSLDGKDFVAIAAMLKLATCYRVDNLRKEILRRLSLSWPTTLSQWETREKSAIGADGVYAPRPKLPHPMRVIAIAREVDAPELLPSAFYDLSRYLPSQLASGYVDPQTAIVHRLNSEDLFRVFRGKEQTSRYFSTFIVNELEGRMPSKYCLYRHEIQPFRKRICQVAFETITLAILRDSNGMVLNHNSDPLFAIADSLSMQTRDDAPGTENRAPHRACEGCRLEYSAIVQEVRDEFWRRVPDWFELAVENWG